jgi:arylsulfatase A-like enzyme
MKTKRSVGFALLAASFASPSAPAQEEQGIAPPPALPAWMEALPAADAAPRQPDANARSRKVTLDGWTRNAIAVTETNPLSLRLEVQAGTRIEVAFAIVPETEDRGPVPVDFTRVATSGDGSGVPQRSFAWRLGPDTSRRWIDDVVDLSAFAGREVALSIRGAPSAPPSDETCASTALVAAPVVLRAPQRPPWNVVLISIDTLRADHLGCYGYGRRTSPRIDALAAEGVRFAWDISAAPWTTPSHMSLLTGLYPSGHHVNESFDVQASRGSDGPPYRTLDRSVPTLAERLRAAGWRTHALTAGVCVEAWLGFDHGFDSFHVGTFKLTPSVPAEVGDFLARHAPSPFFLFLHTYEVHEQYEELERARKWLSQEDGDKVAELLLTRDAASLAADFDAWSAAGLARSEVFQAFYDAGIETADRYVGFVVDRLKALRVWDRTLLIVTSDHGQELADHDPGQICGQHGHTLYDELLHVPLVIHVPDAEARGVVVDGMVQSVDVAPTVLELLGLEPTAGQQGIGLAELARHGGTSPREVALSEAMAGGQEWKALRTSDHKVIAGFDLPGSERSGIPGDAAWLQLFDLAQDPGEHDDLVERAAELLGRMRDRLVAAFGEITRPIGAETPGQPVSAEALQRLRELGYVR